jgi:glycosyltransferase involved in cell wall biosynthesis
MKIAIDISPIDIKSTSQHKIRGVGKYITLLHNNLEKFDSENKYFFTSDPQKYSREVDIIHYPYFDPFFITLPFRNRTKTIVTVHDVIPLVHKKHFPAGLKGNLKWQANRIRLRNTSGIITDSNASKEDIVKVVNCNKDMVHVVYLCVDDDFKKKQEQNFEKDLKKKFDLPKNFFLYVGDVTWNKNLPRLVAAVKKSGVPLVMVGKALTDSYDIKHPWNKDINIVIREIENNPLFKRLGFVTTTELVILYNMAQALLMPSLDEGFGLPVLEAMKSGCPVICSRMGSLPEVGGDAALYVDAESIDDIASGIVRLTGNRKLKEELSKKGLVQSAKFSIQKMIQDTVASYYM